MVLCTSTRERRVNLCFDSCINFHQSSTTFAMKVVSTDAHNKHRAMSSVYTVTVMTSSTMTTTRSSFCVSIRLVSTDTQNSYHRFHLHAFRVFAVRFSLSCLLSSLSPRSTSPLFISILRDEQRIRGASQTHTHHSIVRRKNGCEQKINASILGSRAIFMFVSLLVLFSFLIIVLLVIAIKIHFQIYTCLVVRSTSHPTPTTININIIVVRLFLFHETASEGETENGHRVLSFDAYSCP